MNSQQNYACRSRRSKNRGTAVGLVFINPQMNLTLTEHKRTKKYMYVCMWGSVT